MEPKLMKCGHSANAVDSDGNPTCVICVGIHAGATEVQQEKPDLIGRVAKCAYCKHEQPSNYHLAFFEYRERSTHDDYYCGCRGWD